MNLIWAARGRSWGFRFILDGGFSDPLPVYERAFAGAEGGPTAYRRTGALVALRFPDPLGRRDDAGRVIPHDVVVLPPLADEIRSVDDGQRLVWPLLADAFARMWAMPLPPSPVQVRRALGSDPSDLGGGDAAEGGSGPVGDVV